jgi:hypothetical protein
MDAGRLKKEAVAVYQYYVERFQELLWVFIHLTDGQQIFSRSCEHKGRAQIRKRITSRRRGQGPTYPPDTFTKFRIKR